MNPIKFEDIPLEDPKPDKCCCFPNLLKLFNVKPERPPEKVTINQMFEKKTITWINEVVYKKETK